MEGGIDVNSSMKLTSRGAANEDQRPLILVKSGRSLGQSIGNGTRGK